VTQTTVCACEGLVPCWRDVPPVGHG
jgi:hypothetical protein